MGIGRSRFFLLSILLIGLSLFAIVFVPSVPRAHAQVTTLTIQPSHQANLPVGSTLTFNVTVANTPFNFAGWDVTVVTDNTVLSPQSVTVCNAIGCNTKYSDAGGTNFMPGGTDAQCINGQSSGAFNVCGGNDGPGVAHDAFASSGLSGGALLLFTITYKVIATGASNVVLGPDLLHPESVTGITNHILDNTGADIVADETGGSYGAAAPAFDYSLSNNGPVTIQAGMSGSATITATLTAGTAQPVTLSCANPLPTGITCGSFTVNPVTPASPGATSSLPINVASTVAAGSYTVQVTGTPAGATASGAMTSVSVMVTAPPPAFDYSLSNSGPVSIQAGSSGTVTITAMLTGGTQQSVTLSCVGSSLPAGVTCGSFTVNPVTPSSTGATSILTVNVASSVAPGPYNFMVTGTPAGATASAATTTVSLTVTVPPPAFDYSLSNNSPVSIQSGSSGTVTVTATLTAGIAQAVTLSCSSLPAGITCGSFTVGPVTPSLAGATSDLTVNVVSSVAAGSYSFDVTGTPAGATASGATTHVSITVTPPPFDYSLTNNGPVTIQSGSSGTVTITATLTAGNAQPVTLSCASLPAGITCGSFTVSPVTPSSTGATSVLTINVASSVVAGPFTFQVTGSPAGATASGATTTVSLTVTAPPPPAFDYSLTNNSPVTIQAGSSGSVAITATLTAGTAVPVTLSCVTSTLPAGVTCGSFTVNPVSPTATGATSDLTINIASSVAAGSISFDVTGTPAGATTSAATTIVSVMVTSPPPPAFDYSLSNNGPVTIQAGSSGSVTVTATLTAGTATPVTLSCVSSSLPAGITCGSFTMNPVTPTGSSDLTINVASSVAAGSYSFDVTGAPLGATTTATTVSVMVTAPPPAFDYSLSNNGPVTVQSGSSGTVTITATLLSGTAQPVTLSCVPLPPVPQQLACDSFTVNPVTPTSTGAASDLSFTVISGASGILTFQVTGSPLGATTTTTTVTVNVTPPPAFDYSLSNNSPVTIQAGSSGTVTITATLTAGAAQSVMLSCVGSSLPAGVTCGSFTVNPVTPTLAGATSVLTVNVASSIAPGPYSFMVTGTPAGATASGATTSVSITVTAPPPPTFDYSLSNNGPVTIQSGSSGTVTITAMLTSGTAQSVMLSCDSTTLPSGITCGSFTINPVTPTTAGGTSDLTINIASSVAAGSYSFDVTGLPLGATTTATTVSVMVTSPPPAFDYSLSNNGPVSIQAGSSGTVSITATLTAGTAQSVTLSCVGSTLPAGITCGSFSVNPVTPTGSSDLTINIASSVAAGGYSFDVTGNPLGATTTPTTVRVTVTVVTGQADFQLSASSTSLSTMGESSLCEGSSTLCDDEASTTLTLTSVNGFSGSIRLRVSVSPNDGTLTAYCSPRTVFLKVDGTRKSLCQVEPEINPSSPVTYTVTIRATNGTITHTVTLTVTVTHNPFVPDADTASLSLLFSAPVLTTSAFSLKSRGAAVSDRDDLGFQETS